MLLHLLFALTINLSDEDWTSRDEAALVRMRAACAEKGHVFEEFTKHAPGQYTGACNPVER